MVFVNCDWETYREVFHLIGDAHQRTVEPGSHMEDCVVSVKPQHNVWSSFEDGRLVVQRLDVDNIRILNNIMAQTVILDYNEREVDAMLSTVRGLNSALEGHSSEMPRPPALYATLAQSNNISIKAIMLGVTQKFVHSAGLAMPIRCAHVSCCVLLSARDRDRRLGRTSGSSSCRRFLWRNTNWKTALNISTASLPTSTKSPSTALKFRSKSRASRASREWTTLWVPLTRSGVDRDNHFIRLERMIVFLIMAEIAVSLIDMPFAQYASSAWAMLSHVVK